MIRKSKKFQIYEFQIAVNLEEYKWIICIIKYIYFICFDLFWFDLHCATQAVLSLCDSVVLEKHTKKPENPKVEACADEFQKRQIN